jgi:hypothetical protein
MKNYQMENNKEVKKYIFKCGHKNGEHYCNGVHEFIITDEFIDYLVHRMIYVYNLKVDKYLIFKTIENFHKYIEERYKKNQDEPVFNHWSTVDIYAEFLYDFTEKEFGKWDEQSKINNMNTLGEYHTYFIAKDKNNQHMLVHTSQMVTTPEVFEGSAILHVLKTHEYEKAKIEYNNFILNN